MPESFKSPLTGLPYVSLTDVYPSFPNEASRFKMMKTALGEMQEREMPDIGPWDVAFVALINRQIEILGKAKSMLIQQKFFIRHHGDNFNSAKFLNEFEIIPNKEGAG